MPSIKDLADKMKALMETERRECNWDHATFAKSPYLYMSKGGINTWASMIEQLNDLAAHYAAVDMRLTREMSQHAGALQELTRIADESEDLKTLITSRGAVIKDMMVETQFLRNLLRRMRDLFGGQVKDPKHVGVLLDEVDKVLK